MKELSNLAFHDNVDNPNHDRGVTFWAAGLVTAKYFDGEPSTSGKDYTVVYINPFGEIVTEWRSTKDITLIQLDPTQYNELRAAIKALI